MSNPESPENIVAELADFRQRVIEADKLRLQGEGDKADTLMPSRDEVIEAVRRYRKSLEGKAKARSSTSAKKAAASKIQTMENLADLFK